MGLALLDSSVVVAFLDRDDDLHEAADRAVRQAAAEHQLGVSVITVAEVLAGAKHGHHDEDLVRRFFTQAVASRLPVDEAIAERAAELRGARAGLRMPDALILATADRVGDVVLTGDGDWSRIRGLRCRVQPVA